MHFIFPTCLTNILLDTGHAIGPTENTVGILCITHKGNHMNTVRKYYTYKESKNGTQINDKHLLKTQYLIQ